VSELVLVKSLGKLVSIQVSDTLSAELVNRTRTGGRGKQEVNTFLYYLIIR